MLEEYEMGEVVYKRILADLNEVDTLKDKLKSSEECYKQLTDAIGNVSKEEDDNQAKMNMIELQQEIAVLQKDNEKHMLQISLTSDKNYKMAHEYNQLISGANKEKEALNKLNVSLKLKNDELNEKISNLEKSQSDIYELQS